MDGKPFVPGITAEPAPGGGTRVTIRQHLSLAPGTAPQKREATIILTPNDLAAFKAKLG